MAASLATCIGSGTRSSDGTARAQLRSLEAFLETFPWVERVMLDGIERPLQRPQDPEAQKLN